METFCAASGHSKYRPATSYYQPQHHYARSLRQNEYSTAGAGRHSALLWQERGQNSNSRGKLCSIALVAASFIVVIAVLCIGGLALYMGTLRTEPTSPLLTFSCSARISRGDRFVGALQEKAKRYRQQLEMLYQRSLMGPALISCAVERFGNDTFTIFFRLTFNRRKIPRSTPNVEKSLRDILLGDALSRKPIFKTVRFDPKSIFIRQTLDSDLHNTPSYQRDSKPREPLAPPTRSKNGVVLKPSNRHNFTLTADLPIRKKPAIEEPDIKEEDLPVIHGSFKITKTDADITEKKRGQQHQIETSVEVTTSKPKKLLRTTGLSRRNFTTTTTTTTTTPKPITTTLKPTTTSTTPMTTSTTTETLRPKPVTQTSPPILFTLPSTISMDSKPWIPIVPDGNDSDDIRNKIHKVQPEVSTVPSNGNDRDEASKYTFIGHVNRQPPIYTSFTNPSLSFYSLNAETLGTSSIKSHPIPINKIADPGMETVWTSSAEVVLNDELDKSELREESMELETEILSTTEPADEDVSGGFVEVETFKYNPSQLGSDKTNVASEQWDILNGTKSDPILKLFNKTESVPKKNYNQTLQAIIATDQGGFSNNTLNNEMKNALLKNISSIFNNLASTLGILPQVKETTTSNTKPIVTTTTAQPPQVLQDIDNGFKPTSISEEPTIGQGIVEVVMDPNDQELLMHQAEMSTKQPLVTLIPVKSNSGVGRPLRRRPQFSNQSSADTTEDSLSEIRSFPTNLATKQNGFDEEATVSKSPAPYVQTEVVTSISSEVSRIKINRSQLNDYKLVGVLNFANDKFADNKEEETKSITTIITNGSKRNNSKILMQSKENSSEVLDPQRHPKTDVNDTETMPTPSKLVQHAIGNVINKDKMESSNETAETQPADSNILDANKLKLLADISVVNKNNMTSHYNTNESTKEKSTNETIISTKAVSSSFSINNSNFKLLTKTYNKVPVTFKEDEKTKSTLGFNQIPINFFTPNGTVCNNNSVRCGDEKCLPETTRCNQFVDCNDGADEKNCTCADYLRSQYLMRKICDGVKDCWDNSDENNCEWCSPEKYVCGNSKQCINRTKICDGIRDCPHGDDERHCVTIAPNHETVDEFSYHSEGYLMVRKQGVWGKFCTENFENVVTKSQTSWRIEDLGQAVCRAMTYQELERADSVKDKSYGSYNKYFELSYNFRNETKSNLSFKQTTCISGQIIRVKCKNLECGARPQAIKQIARRYYRIVGGTNAGLGAWPWQAALYKEGEFQCGGTLLTDRWLLSAGHCFYHTQQDHWVARLGALRRGTALPTPYEQLRPIINITLHPDYVDVGFINDIALLQMASPVIFSDYVRPICLPNQGIAPRDTQLCTVVGWGQLFEVGRIFPDTLQEVQVPIISTSECRKRTIFLPLYRVTDNMFCAGYERGGRDACLGDSGGPLMCPEQDGRWTLHGVTSNGYGCARANRPGVYTKVGNYINWIKSHTEISPEEPNSARIKVTQCLGHRCPLGECLPKSRLCNGYIECSDGSDEQDCL